MLQNFSEKYQNNRSQSSIFSQALLRTMFVGYSLYSSDVYVPIYKYVIFQGSDVYVLIYKHTSYFQDEDQATFNKTKQEFALHQAEMAVKGKKPHKK